MCTFAQFVWKSVTKVVVLSDHPSAKLCYMVKIPLRTQLQKLLERACFLSKQKLYKKRNKDESYSDLHDGNLYQKLLKSGFFEEVLSLSCSWFTHGVALYKSSLMSVWPLCFTIHELPFSDRFKKENILLGSRDRTFGPVNDEDRHRGVSIPPPHPISPNRGRAGQKSTGTRRPASAVTQQRTYPDSLSAAHRTARLSVRTL